jgi:hypothetical protein
MLSVHRSVVGLHEWFTGLDWGRRFRPGVVTGADLAALLSEDQFVTTRLIGMGYRSDEITYPFGEPSMKWQPGEPVPWLLVSMMPWLTPTPDHLYDELIATARARPPSTMADHYAALFSFLADRTGHQVWIERSGSSIDYVGELGALYPNARFVHIHRDGIEAALSIRAHPFFRLALAIYYDLFPDDVDAPDGDDTPIIRHVVENPPPVEVAGRYWSDQVLRGYRALANIDAGQWLDVRFEELVTDPGPVLRRIEAFFDLPADDTFVTRAAALARGLPPSRADALGDDERSLLESACRPGQMLLGRAH